MSGKRRLYAPLHVTRGRGRSGSAAEVEGGETNDAVLGLLHPWPHTQSHSTCPVLNLKEGK